MPEMPEVETVRMGLKPVLEGRILNRIILRRRNLRIPFPPGFAKHLTGHRIQEVNRRGKYLLIHMDNGWVLIAHLGMSGKFCIHKETPPTPDAHDHVIFETDHGVSIYYHDPRRFGLMTLAQQQDLKNHPFFASMGLEPLDSHMDGPYLTHQLKRRKCPIKTALLDQNIIAGIGNIYASEILYQAGISPLRTANTIKGARAQRLALSMKSVLTQAVAAGGSTLRDHRTPDGGLGYFQQQLAVYGRAGEPCPHCDCDPAQQTGVKHITQSGRSTFYCAKRQR